MQHSINDKNDFMASPWLHYFNGNRYLNPIAMNSTLTLIFGLVMHVGQTRDVKVIFISW